MSYIEENLSKDEKILLKTKVSSYLSLINIIICTSIVFIFSFSLATVKEASLIMTFIAAIYVWLNFINMEMVITNKRAIYKYGIIAINTNEVRLEKIESVNVDKGILGSLLGYGTISFSELVVKILNLKEFLILKDLG